MQHLSWTTWLVAGLSALTVAVETTGTVEVDLVFPRNETYAAPQYMPFVFAISNPSLATLLQSRIEYTVWNSNDTTTQEGMRQNNTVASGNVSLPTTDPNQYENSAYLLHDFSAKFNTEGEFLMLWRLYWYSSNVTLNLWTGGLLFSTTNSDSAQKVNLVTVTSNGTACSTRPGRVIRGMGKALHIKRIQNVPTGTWMGGEKCADVLSQDSLITKPCEVKIDDGAAAGIWASVNVTMCRYRPYPGEETPKDIVCPGKKSGAQKPAAGGLTCLLLLLGLFLKTVW
jgi:hypothetical protein